MQSKQQLVRSLFDNKMLNVLDVFLQNAESQFFLKEISQQSRVPLTSCYRIVRRLLKVGVVHEVKVNRFSVYQLNPSELTAFLEEIVIEEKHCVEDFVEAVRDLPGVQQVILHGAETKDKANVLVIGEDVDTSRFRPLIADMRLNKKFTISALTLNPDQYKQMSDMGLYSGKKKILFDKERES